MKIGNEVFYIEIADTIDKLEKGLSGRNPLKENFGMLFIFPFEYRLIFWMRGTSIPLTLAFLSNEGKITELHDMQPNSIVEIISLTPRKFALELSKGAFSRANAKIGTEIKIIDAPKEYRQLFK